MQQHTCEYARVFNKTQGNINDNNNKIKTTGVMMCNKGS